MTVLLAALLAQAVPVEPSAQPAPGGWPAVVTWSDGGKERVVHLDESLVAERDGDEHTGAALRESGAMVSFKRGRMRVWRVERASSVLTTEPRLLPVYRDEAGGKLRVPVGGVLVVPKTGVASEKVRDAMARGTVVQHGVVKVDCAPAEVFALSKTLSATEGVWWVQPDWWLAAMPK
jgi:hypothetical protein